MNSLDEKNRWSPLEDLFRGANLLLAAPTRHPIDPMRALALLTTEAVAATAGGLGAAAEALSQELGEVVGMS